MKKFFSNRRDLLLGFAFFMLVFFVFHEIYKYKLDSLTMQLLGLSISAMVSILTMSTILASQTEQAKKKEFSTQLFIKKIALYENFLEAIFKSDDDNVITKDEISDIENLTGVAALVAGKELVAVLSQFMVQLKNYGVMYERSLNPKQREHFVEHMKESKAADFLFKRHIGAKKAEYGSDPSAWFVSVDIQQALEAVRVINENVIASQM